DKPFLKFERLLDTYLAYAPKGLTSFIKAMPLWMKQKLFLKKIIRDELKSLTGSNTGKLKILFTEHHLSHAASAYFPSSLSESAIVTIVQHLQPGIFIIRKKKLAIHSTME
ncbi:MAG: hypothetical protein M3015_12985, partial [Bacteroidota bacterium]|nr:hypothetical protein [Bacteroidota bacterium]